MVNKSNIRAPKLSEQIKVEPSIAMVKGHLVDNIDGHVIYFCDGAARIARPDTKDKHRTIIGKPVFSVKIGDHCYHGLCDVGASVNAIPFALYQDMNDIAPAEIEDIDITIKLANRDTIAPIGIVRDVEVLLGKLNILLIFFFLVSHKMIFVPLYLVDLS